MSLNTYPYNPFPASTDKLDEAHNAELQQEVDQLKEDTGELREDVEKLETDKVDTTVIAPEFDAEAGVYSVGDLVMYQGKLYEFTAAHETAGDWDSTEVTEKTVADELSSLESGLTNVTTLISDNDYVNVYRYNSTVHVVLKNGSTQIPNNSILAEGLPVPKDGTNVYSIMQYYDGTNWQIGIVYVSSIGDIGVMNANSQFLTAGNYIKGELVYLVN